MRLRHIEVFHAVYSSGSMTQAAKVLNVSQPSISKVLAHAELQLGFPLFERTKGKLVPTPEAERLHEHVARLYDDLGGVKRVAANLRDSAEGKIRIASTPAMGMDLVPSVVATYMKREPGVFFEIETLHYAEIASALKESRIDIALAFDPPNVPGIAERTITEGEFVLIAPPDMDVSPKPTVTLEDVTNVPFIRLNSRGPLGQLLDAHFEATGAALNFVAAAETYHIAKSLVAYGVGVSIVDEITARSGADEAIQTIRLDPSLTFRVSILQLDNVPLSRVCQAFTTHLNKSIRKLIPIKR